MVGSSHCWSLILLLLMAAAACMNDCCCWLWQMAALIWAASLVCCIYASEWLQRFIVMKLPALSQHSSHACSACLHPSSSSFKHTIYVVYVCHWLAALYTAYIVSAYSHFFSFSYTMYSICMPLVSGSIYYIVSSIFYFFLHWPSRTHGLR